MDKYIRLLEKCYRRKLKDSERAALVFALEEADNPERVTYQFMCEWLANADDVERARTHTQKRRAQARLDRMKLIEEEKAKAAIKTAKLLAEQKQRFDAFYTELLEKGKATRHELRKLAYYRVNSALPDGEKINPRTQRVHSVVRKEMQNILREIQRYQQHNDLV